MIIGQATNTVLMKCFERLLMSHIKQSIVITLDTQQDNYRWNISIADGITAVIYQAFTYLENKDSYVRMLFLDFNSTLNTIIPQTLMDKQ